MTTATRSLCGRQRERAALSQLLCDVRSGRSRVLVIRGEPGIGKTALLDDLCARADDVVLVRGAGWNLRPSSRSRDCIRCARR